MASSARVKPRKEATQDRSRATVDALVEATARILIREGFDKASTNRVAEMAGVSIGSLYQYFPSKESLVAAVITRHQEEIAHAIRAELAEVSALPVNQAIRTLVAAAVKAHRIDAKLHRVLAEQIPRVGKLEKLETFNREYFVLFRTYLGTHRDEIHVDDLDLATFICITAIEALTHTAVLHHPERLMDDEGNALIRDATKLVAGYLTGA